MQLLAATLAAAAFGSASAASIHLADRSADACSTQGYVTLCSDSRCQQIHELKQVALDGSCQGLPQNYYHGLGILDPAPNIFCSLFADSHCSQYLGGYSSASPNLYSIADSGSTVHSSDHEKGHAAAFMRCFPCSSCK